MLDSDISAPFTAIVQGVEGGRQWSPMKKKTISIEYSICQNDGSEKVKYVD